MNKTILFILLISLLIVAACQDPSPFKDEGKDILEAYGEIKSDTLYAKSGTFLVNDKVSTASSVKLLLGSYQNFEARSLLKFDYSAPDSTILDELHLLISGTGDFGEGMGSLNGMVYRVTEPWAESVNSDPDWDYKSNIDYSPETSAEFSLGDLDSTLYTDYSIELPVKLGEAWKDTSSGGQNHGLLLDFTSSGFLREFSSREGFFTSRLPRIVFVYHKEGGDSTID